MKNETKACRHGWMTYHSDDEFVGRSLKLYGEYSEGEVTAIGKILRSGDVAIDVGANIGALTVPMSKMVGPTGKVIAFEPVRENARLLYANIIDNQCKNVEVHKAAASNRDGYTNVPLLEDLGHNNYGRAECGVTGDRVICQRIDDLNLDKVKLIKIDAEGHELEVLEGARETIKRCRPLLYVENDRENKAAALVAALIDMGYWLWWHRSTLFNPDNFAGNARNVFGDTVSLMMIGAPEDMGVQIDGCDDVPDIRDDDRMFDREIERYSRRSAREPGNLTARLMVAHYCNIMQQTGLAKSLVADNLARDQVHTPSLAIRGLMRLQEGHYREGWLAYELRYQQKRIDLFGGKRKHGVPHWDGKPTQEPLLIWSEQGFGDTIMFSRFFRQVRMRAPNAVLEVQPELYELFQTSHVSPAGLFRLHRDPPPYALHCSLPSTPAMLGDIDGDKIRCAPYLHADRGLVEHWRARGHPKIGICCAGSPRSERPFTRDLPDGLLKPIAEKYGPFLQLEHTGQFESFADTAAAISTLDLVITVDTSIAHLAAALGVETWLLLSFDPDWRWGLKGDRTVWYDNMRIFRQPSFRDWKSVIEQVDAALALGPAMTIAA